MKKYAPYFLLFILSILIWDAMFDGGGMHFTIGDESFDGPVGGIFGALLATGGAIIGLVVAVVVGVVLAVVFAGVGIVLVAALAVAALITILAVSPLLLPVLIPVAIIWLIARRNRDRSRVDLGKPAAA